MVCKFHFSKRKVFVVVFGLTLFLIGTIFVTLQTIKIVGGLETYDEFIKISNNKISQLSQKIETVHNTKETNYHSENGQESDNILNTITSNIVNKLTINPQTTNLSGLTLAQLSNTSPATQSSKLVLTVDESGSVLLVDNTTGSILPNAIGGNPLYYDSETWKGADKLFFNSGEIGIGKNPGVELDVNGKTAIEGKLTIHSDWEDNLIELFPNGNSGYLSSNGGALYINNSNNYGSAIGIYSDANGEALGNMINVKVDNPLFNQAAFYMNYDGLSNAVEIVANTNDESSNALSITNHNQLDSALGVIGYETAKGTIKVSHIKSGNDSNSSGVSIDLQGDGTAAQGIYVDSTATGGTTGNLLRLRNQTIDRFVVDYNGSLTIGTNGSDTSLTKLGNTLGDEFFIGTNGAFRVQRSITDSEAFRTQVVGDTQGRWLGTADGKLKWGDGSSAQDIILERSAPSKLLLNGATFDIKSAALNTDALVLTASDNSRLGRFAETSGGHGWFEVDNSSGVAQVLLRGDGGDSYFRTSELGVGTASPVYQLDILDDAASSYATNIFNDGNDANRYGLRIQAGADDASGTTYYLDAYDGDGDQVGYLSNSAGTFGLTDISDIRTKTNIENTKVNGLEIVENLRVVDYNRLSHPNDQIIHGFIAQEVNQVFPEMVTTAPDGLLGLQQATLIPVLTKAIQQQQNQISSFKESFDQSFEINKNLSDLLDELIIKTKAIFNNTVEFTKQAIFNHSIVAGENIAGLANIPAGTTSITIYFQNEQEKTPLIQLTAQSEFSGNLYVTNVNTKSFEIHLSEIQSQNIPVAWLSIIPK